MATKAKRKLKDIDFSNQGAHVALVSKDQGGPANGHDYALVIKSNNFSQEFVQKVQQVRVTMELPDFLRKFFNVYYEDAEILARMMGYETATEEESVETSYEDYIQSKLNAFEILKSAAESESIAETFSKLSEDEYLSMLKDQELVEKALVKIEKSKEVTDVTEAKVETIVADEVTVSDKTLDEEKVKKMEQEEVQKAVDKAVAEAVASLQKANEAQKIELQKALELVEVFKAEKKQAISKARNDSLKSVVADEAKAEILFKALDKLEDQAEFDAVVGVLKSLQEVVEKSELFKEAGASVEDAPAAQKDSPLVAAIKKQQGLK